MYRGSRSITDFTSQFKKPASQYMSTKYWHDSVSPFTNIIINLRYTALCAFHIILIICNVVTMHAGKCLLNYSKGEWQTLEVEFISRQWSECRHIATGQWAWCRTKSDTDPRMVRRTAPCPRVPRMIILVFNVLAEWHISLPASPCVLWMMNSI